MAPTAASIYQRNLDAVSHALWARDLPAMLRHIAIPNQVVTEDAEIVIASPDEMFIVMTDFRDAMEGLGADRYLRLCRDAAYVPGRPDMISGRHDTFILRNGRDLRPPYRSRMTLIRTDAGDWRALRVESAASNAEARIISPDLAAGQRRELQRLFDRLDRGPGREG